MKAGRSFKRIRTFLQQALLVLAMAFVGIYAIANWHDLIRYAEQANPALLAVAVLGFYGYFILRSLAWRSILRQLGFTMGPEAALSAWMYAEITRYVPGTVWSFLSRVERAGRHGIPAPVGAASLALEAILLLGSSGLFAGLVMLGAPDGVPGWLKAAGPLAAFPALILIVRPNVIAGTLRRLSPSGAPALTSIGMARSFFLMGLAWAAYGGASYAAAAAMGSLGTASWWWIPACFITSWLIGYLSIITPMGIGVREGALVALLSPMAGVGTAIAVAATTRMWLMASELSLIGILAGPLAIKRVITAYRGRGTVRSQPVDQAH